MRHQALLFSQGNDRAAAWEEALFRGLGDKGAEYEKVSETNAAVPVLMFRSLSLNMLAS